MSAFDLELMTVSITVETTLKSANTQQEAQGTETRYLDNFQDDFIIISFFLSNMHFQIKNVQYTQLQLSY